MVRNREEIEVLIGAYLSGEATPEQAIELEDWKSESEENLKLFQYYESIAYAASGEKIQSIDKKAAWARIEKEKKTAKVVPIWKNKLFYASAAAIALIVIVIASLMRSGVKEERQTTAENPVADSTRNEQVIFASTHVKSITLEDQSQVELRPGSKLVLDKNFNRKDRRSTLEGSGKFTVVHDETNPFILMVNEMEIYDVGTVFEVHSSGDTVKVIVTEGAVELRLNGNTVDLVEGDSAFYVVSERLVQRYETPEKRQDVTFEFDGTSLKEVVSVLSDFFKRTIEIKNLDLEKCELSVTFKNKSLAEILDVIEIMLDLNIVSNASKIEIYGEAC